MVTTVFTSSSAAVDINSEATWNELYSLLHSVARTLVYSLRVSSWWGQEEDMVEDIVQESARRLLERVRKAERGEAEPVNSLKHMMITIAKNYCKDLRRSDRRLTHMVSQDDAGAYHTSGDEPPSLLDAVTEHVFEESVFAPVAHEIASFPAKQRNALLIDLANRMFFDEHPTALQQAFLQEGIQLEQYQCALPADPKGRSRHVSLLTYAYQRVGHLPCVQEYRPVSQNITRGTGES